jgi:hypothetical protein
MQMDLLNSINKSYGHLATGLVARWLPRYAEFISPNNLSAARALSTNAPSIAHTHLAGLDLDQQQRSRLVHYHQIDFTVAIAPLMQAMPIGAMKYLIPLGQRLLQMLQHVDFTPVPIGAGQEG